MKPSIVIALALLTSACASSKSEFEGSGPPPQEDLVYGGPLGIDTIAGNVVLDTAAVEYPLDVGVVGQHLVVLETYASPALRVVRIGSWKQENATGRRGSGPGEARTPWLIAISPAGEPWMFDASLARLSRLVKQAPGSDAFVPDSAMVSVKFPSPIFSMAWLNDTTLIANGFFEKSQFALVDANGSLRGETGAAPIGDERVPTSFRNEIQQGSIAVHPSGKMFAFGSKYAGRLGIYDAAGTLIKSAKTPFEFEPAFTLMASPTETAVGTNEKLRFGYVAVAATEDRIFGLFSGRSRLNYPSNAHMGRFVHEFNWSGELLHIYRLDDGALRIAIDGSGSLYAVNGGTRPRISQYTLRRDHIALAAPASNSTKGQMQ